MSGAPWGTGRHVPVEELKIILGPRTCHHCLNPKASQLHRELCVTGTEPS
jgi:hypothetical protein